MHYYLCLGNFFVFVLTTSSTHKHTHAHPHTHLLERFIVLLGVPAGGELRVKVDRFGHICLELRELGRLVPELLHEELAHALHVT